MPSFRIGEVSTVKNVGKPRPTSETAASEGEEWPLWTRPGFLVRRLHQIHVSLFSEQCAAFGLTPVQYSLLSTLRDLGDSDQTTLAHAVALDRTTTTGALKRLSTRGLVSRSVSTSDRRAQICRITPEGKTLHSSMKRAVHEAHALTIGSLGPTERTIFVDLLQRVVAGHDHRRGQVDIG